VFYTQTLVWFQFILEGVLKAFVNMNCRKIKIGVLWPWCWTGYSYGYSRSLLLWAQFWSCARLQRSTMTQNQSIGICRSSLENSFHHRRITTNTYKFRLRFSFVLQKCIYYEQIHVILLRRKADGLLNTFYRSSVYDDKTFSTYEEISLKITFELLGLSW